MCRCWQRYSFECPVCQRNSATCRRHNRGHLHRSKLSVLLGALGKIMSRSPFYILGVAGALLMPLLCRAGVPTSSTNNEAAPTTSTPSFNPYTYAAGVTRSNESAPATSTPSRWSQDNVMKLYVGMSAEQVDALFGMPVSTQGTTCGSETKKPWTCIIWNYNAHPNLYNQKVRIFYFAYGKAGLYLVSWQVDSDASD